LFSLAGALLEPMIGTMALTAFWYLLRKQEVEGVHVALFLAVSYTPFSMVRRSLSSVPKSIRSSRSFYAFQHVKPFDAVLARYILELTLTMLGGFILLFLLWWFLDLSIRTDRLLGAIGLFAALNAMCIGLSLFIGVYGTRYPIVFKTIQVVSRGLMFVSAVVHTVSELPADAQDYIAYNPVTHFQELLRDCLLGLKPFQDASLGFFLISSLVALFLGFASYYANRFKVIER
jgi:capsular polysaccharide transport system permease protein